MKTLKFASGFSIVFAIILSSIAMAGNAYKVSFFENDQWRGDMPVFDYMSGQCTVQYYFCPQQKMFYGCSGDHVKYQQARSKGWDYKVTSGGREYCRNR